MKMTALFSTLLLLSMGLTIKIVVSTPIMSRGNMKNSENDTSANTTFAAFSEGKVSKNVFEPDKAQLDTLSSAATNMDDGLNATKNEGVIEFGPVASDDADQDQLAEEPFPKSFSDNDMEYERDQLTDEIPDLSDILKNKNKENPLSYAQNKIEDIGGPLPGQYYSPAKESKGKEEPKDNMNEMLEMSESFVPMENMFDPSIEKTVSSKLTVVFDVPAQEDNEGKEMPDQTDPMKSQTISQHDSAIIYPDQDFSTKLNPTPKMGDTSKTDSFEEQEDTEETDEGTMETTEPFEDSTKTVMDESEIEDGQEAYDFADESNDPNKYDARRKVTFAEPGLEEETMDGKQIPNYYIPYVPYVH